MELLSLITCKRGDILKAFDHLGRMVAGDALTSAAAPPSFKACFACQGEGLMLPSDGSGNVENMFRGHDLTRGAEGGDVSGGGEGGIAESVGSDGGVGKGGGGTGGRWVGAPPPR